MTQTFCNLSSCMADYYSYAVYILVMKFCLSSNKIVICYPTERKVSLDLNFAYG